MRLGLAMPPLQLTARAVPKKAIVVPAIDFCGTSLMGELFTTRGVSLLHLSLRVSARVLYSKAVFILIQGDVFLPLEAAWPEFWVVKGAVSESLCVCVHVKVSFSF